MTNTLHSFESLDLVAGLDCYEVDRRLFKSNVASDVAQRTLAFYLFELHDRRETQLLGYGTAKDYAVARLGISARRTNEPIQAGGMLNDLEDVDAAFLAGRLSWSKVLVLMPVARVSNQDAWVERAEQLSCERLKKAVSQVKRGQAVTGDSEAGLPRPMFEFRVAVDLEAHEKLEKVREYLMRESGRAVADAEVLDWLVAGCEMKEVAPEKDAARRVECEEKETPDWLRREVLARDGHECVHCGKRGKLHAHHVVFRTHGGRTSANNLASLCLGCHGLVHSGLLRIEGEAPRGLEFLDQHGNPLVPPARAESPLLSVLRTGGRPPEADIPDPITAGWIERHPRLDWSWIQGLRIKPGATAERADGVYEEVPDSETAKWINRQPQLQWVRGHGLRISLD